MEIFTQRKYLLIRTENKYTYQGNMHLKLIVREEQTEIMDCRLDAQSGIICYVRLCFYWSLWY